MSECEVSGGKSNEKENECCSTPIKQLKACSHIVNSKIYTYEMHMSDVELKKTKNSLYKLTRLFLLAFGCEFENRKNFATLSEK